MAEQGSATTRVRNVVLLGHGGTGKTTLAEALLTAAGAGDGRGGILDFEPEERDREHSLSLATASLQWQGHKLNLLDAPGAPESVGEAYPALQAADLAVFVVDASVGIQPQHEQLWEACARLELPRLVFLNKLDRENAAFQANIDALQRRYDTAAAPVLMPIGAEGDLAGVIDLLHFKAIRHVRGKREVGEIPQELSKQAEQHRETLIEAIVELDDELLERYLEGDTPEIDDLVKCFKRGITSCDFFPVLCGSATLGIGVESLADFIVEQGPSPVDRAAARGLRVDGPTALYVTKTLSDPYVGRINVLRVLSGTLAQDDTLVVSRTGNTVRLHQLFFLRGKDQTPASSAEAGDIVAVAKLDDVVTTDVLRTKDAKVDLEPVPLPEPFHRVAVVAASASDEDKLSTSLQRLAEEDPAFRVERDADTGQLVLRLYGPGHADVAMARLKRKFGVTVKQVPLRLNYRETLRGPGKAIGRHVKQSGGHGQYGIAHIEVEPLPRGGGFEFEDKIVGGVIPNQFIPSVEKGVREAMTQGVLAGYPVVDVRVKLVDGKHHSVDSSQVAFEVAGSLAFRSVAEQAGVTLLEPVMEVAINVPEDMTGDVMGDLNSRRGRIQGMEPAGHGRSIVRALVPEAELTMYTAELRSLTSGAGTVSMRYDHHEECPEHVAKKVIAAAREDR
ncbi:MAG: elongation factor G [Egibacteraceae bacterium]